MNMNKSGLVNEISKKSRLTKAQVRQIVDETFEYIAYRLSKGDKFQILGFGTFSVKKRASRDGTNPQTGEKIKIDAKNLPVFTPGKKISGES